MGRKVFINILLSISLFIDVMFSLAYSSFTLNTSTELFIYRLILIILLIFSWNNYFDVNKYTNIKKIFLILSQLIYVCCSVFILVLSIINNLFSYQIIQFLSSFIIVVFSIIYKYLGEKK